MKEAMPHKILIVDDIPANLKTLSDLLKPQGYHILVAPNGDVALKVATKMQPDVILLDVLMPGMDGFEVCHRLKQTPETADIAVIFVTAKGETENLVKGFGVGGVDYIPKPFEKAEVLARVGTHLKNAQLTRALREKNQALEREIARRQQAEEARKSAEADRKRAAEQLSQISEREAKRWGIDGFIGKSQKVGDILRDIVRLQTAPMTSVLISGESGTGKELVARAIHFGSPNATAPFVPVNCSAIPGELAESAFFGHVRGAFTGADRRHKGYFEEANGGTLFLDEIGDMPSPLQAKLLRTLEDGVITPVGGTQPQRVNVRVLAATNSDLQAQIASGRFREDLYFRLARFVIPIPPLRERREDIPLLAQHFLRMFANEMGRPGIHAEAHNSAYPEVHSPALSQEAMGRLMQYDFPGNIRELKNIIEHALIKCDGSSVMPEHLHLIEPNVNSKQAHLPPPTESDYVPRPLTDEDRIYQYVLQHGSINNTECRQLLDVDIHRATYLLKKMCVGDILRRTGRHRSTRYLLR